MKILVAAWGSAGEHVPVASLAGQLTDAGYEVHVLAAAPFRVTFGRRIASFTGLPLGDQEPGFVAKPAAGRVRASAIWRRSIDPEVETQFGAADRLMSERGIDLALASQIVPGVACAAETRGVAFTPIFLYPFSVLDPEDLPVFIDWQRLTTRATPGPCAGAVAAAIRRSRRRSMPSLMALRQRLALPDDGGLVPGYAGRGLLLFPAMLMRGPLRHIPVRRRSAVPANPVPEVRDFLRQGRRPWLVSFGSFLGSLRAPLIGEVVRLLRANGERVIVAWGLTDRPERRLDGDVLHLVSPRLGNLYGHVKGVVHHGGINMSVEALAAGLPCLVLPQLYDQLDNGLRLARLGVGAVVAPAHQREPARLAAAIASVVADTGLAARAASAASSVESGVTAAEALAALGVE